jgi:hypothetical protein
VQILTRRHGYTCWSGSTLFAHAIKAYLLSYQSGNGLEGDLGEIVSHISRISPSAQPREKFFSMFYTESQNPSWWLLPEIGKSSPCSDSLSQSQPIRVKANKLRLLLCRIVVDLLYWKIKWVFQIWCIFY